MDFHIRIKNFQKKTFVVLLLILFVVFILRSAYPMTDEISMGNVGKTGSLQLSQNIDNLEIIDVETLIIFNSLTTERSLWDIKINARATMIIESNSIILFQFTETLFIDSVIVNNFLSPSHTTQNGDITSIEITLITEINQNETMHISLSGMVQHELSNIDDQLWLFKYKWGFNFPIPKMNLSIHLPPSSGVSGQLDLLDIFPGGYSLITDGKIIIINWANLSVADPSDSKTIIIEIISDQKTIYDTVAIGVSGFNLSSYLFGIVTALFGFSLLLALFLIMKRVSPFILLNNLKNLKNDNLTDSLNEVKLKTFVKPIIVTPTQKKLLLLIEKSNGVLTQNELYLTSGLSKARVSQYVKELEDLALISKEKTGRENIIYLRVDLKFD